MSYSHILGMPGIPDEVRFPTLNERNKAVTHFFGRDISRYSTLDTYIQE